MIFVAVVANYTYDAWGRLLSVKNASGSTISDASHIANVNPIRYRGYFYDTETKLYYCNSRYYDPQVKRFINADVLLDTGTGFLGYNMFAYCNNNPVMNYDPSGCIVTDWDRAHLDAYDLETLQLYTDRWHSSWLSAEGKAYQHQLAVELRSKYLSDKQYVASNGYVMTRNSFGGYGVTMSYIYHDSYTTRYIDYSIEKTVIRIDVTSDEFYQIELNWQYDNLATNMLDSYEKIYGKAFPGRTKMGLVREIADHRNLNWLIPSYPNFQVADLESSEYEGDNAFWFFYE